MKKNYFILLFFISTVYLTYAGEPIEVFANHLDPLKYHPDNNNVQPPLNRPIIQCPQNKSPYNQCQGCFRRAYIRNLMAIRHQKKASSACS